MVGRRPGSCSRAARTRCLGVMHGRRRNPRRTGRSLRRRRRCRPWRRSTGGTRRAARWSNALAGIAAPCKAARCRHHDRPTTRGNLVDVDARLQRSCPGLALVVGPPESTHVDRDEEGLPPSAANYEDGGLGGRRVLQPVAVRHGVEREEVSEHPVLQVQHVRTIRHLTPATRLESGWRQCPGAPSTQAISSQSAPGVRAASIF